MDVNIILGYNEIFFLIVYIFEYYENYNNYNLYIFVF